MVKIPVMGEVDEMPEQEMAAERRARRRARYQTVQSGILMPQQATCI